MKKNSKTTSYYDKLRYVGETSQEAKERIKLKRKRGLYKKIKSSILKGKS